MERKKGNKIVEEKQKKKEVKEKGDSEIIKQQRKASTSHCFLVLLSSYTVDLRIICCWVWNRLDSNWYFCRNGQDGLKICVETQELRKAKQFWKKKRTKLENSQFLI